jgi:hypothetical protein
VILRTFTVLVIVSLFSSISFAEKFNCDFTDSAFNTVSFGSDIPENGQPSYKKIFGTIAAEVLFNKNQTINNIALTDLKTKVSAHAFLLAPTTFVDNLSIVLSLPDGAGAVLTCSQD